MGAVCDESTARRGRRVFGFLVALAATGVLGLAAWLEPSPTGLGTHSQLNLPPCGWIVTMDLPCPTCGMSTAFAHAADGHLLQALHAQPLGGLLAIAIAMALFVGLYVAATGSRLGRLFTRLWGRRAPWFLGLMIIGAWVYKILSYKGLLW
jgi:hypothetical protein